VSVDGGASASATGTSSWSYALNTLTLKLKNGSHTIAVTAADTAGNVSAAQSLTIQVQNVPTVAITSPANGATVNSAITVAGTATVEAGGTLKSVSVSIDGGAAASATGTSSWSFSLNPLSLGLKNGSHTITVTAADASGNSSAAQSVTVSVAISPTAAITSPAGGAVLSGSAQITGTASEPGGTVQSVSVSVDGGAYAAAQGTTQWSYTLSSQLTNGAHTLAVKAVDAAGNGFTTPSLSVTTENNLTIQGTLQASGSAQCTTYTSNSCNPGAGWSGTASVCDQSGLGICGSVQASGTGNQSVTQTVSLSKKGQSVGQVTVSGQVNAANSTSCTAYDDPTTSCVTDPVWTCDPECVWDDETCYDDDGNPYDCGYYDCSQEDCYWDYSQQTCTTTDNYYYTCTESVSGSGILSGKLQ
jgi:hypothetical protein